MADKDTKKKAAAPKKTAAAKPAAPAKKAAAAEPQRKRAAGKAAKGAKQEPKKPKLWHSEKKPNPLFVARPKNFRIGNNLLPRNARNLTRFVRWPWYIRLQRQKRILFDRLKVPPPINQFSQVLSYGSACHLFRILEKIRPEERAARKRRRLEAAKKIVEMRSARVKKIKEKLRAIKLAHSAKKPEGEHVEKKHEHKRTESEKKKLKAARIAARLTRKKEEAACLAQIEKPIQVKYGLNHVTRLIEKNKAQLVIIATDVDPIELVVWLPTLCRKKKIPYCIVKNKARLGRVVHKKTSAVLAITDVRKEDRPSFNKLVETCKTEFNNNEHIMKTWGGKKLGCKRRQAIAKMHLTLKRDAARKARGQKN